MNPLPLLVLFLALISLTRAATTPRPNVLIVLVDDAGYGDFACHGQPFVKTPNIDKLHGESVRFTDFHVTPMCTPTRGQLLTGVDAVRNGATSVTGGRSFLRPEIPTLPQMLAKGGYRTGIFGKWHLGDSYPHRPMDKGFQEAVWVKGWGFTSAPEFANKLTDGRYYRGDKEGQFKGYITDVCFDEAMAWMKSRQASREPFFCYIPLHAAHIPHQVPAQYAEPYLKPAPNLANFFGMIANIDENMGRLDAFLRESGLRENTIVIFMTDNGATAGQRFYNAGMRGKKTEFHEGGHRVPAFVRWPAGKLRAAGDIAQPAQVQDITPTLLEFTGVAKAANAHFDGISLAKVLRSPAERIPERTFVVQYSRAKLEKWECAVVSGSWRLVHGKELYDLAKDPAQANDVAAQNPEVLRRLRDHYEAWWSSLDAKTREFVPTSLGSKAQPVVTLTSADWQDVYCDNANHIRESRGGTRGGPWHVRVEEAGDYEISLRRWPPELDLALTASDGAPNVKVLPIAAASVRVGELQQSAKAAGDSAKEIVLRMKLPKGQTQLHAWFQDAQGQDVSGAFYATVTRK